MGAVEGEGEGEVDLKWIQSTGLKYAICNTN